MSLGYRKGAKSGVEPEAKTGIRASIYSDGMNQLSTVELGTKGEPWQHVNIGFRSNPKKSVPKARDTAGATVGCYGSPTEHTAVGRVNVTRTID